MSDAETNAAAESTVGESAHGIVPARALTRGRASVVRLPRHWFIICESRELRKGPIKRELQAVPMVLWRDDKGVPHAALDRCPHRNVPLSLGSVAPDGTLECAYHGWRFDGDGHCVHVPSLTGPCAAASRDAASYACREQQGFIWLWSGVGEVPDVEPHRFEFDGVRGYTTTRQVVEARSTMYSAIENALDVPHTAFLHRGLFRSASRGITITAKVHRTADRVSAEYVGEPRPPGLIARILSPSGGIVTHFDRFILPCVAQVEYRIGTENHFVVDSVMTPVDDFLTRIFAVVSFRSRVPGWLIRPFVRPLAMRVFMQDAKILAAQTDVIHRFGGEQFASSPIDVLGRHIWRLLTTAARGGRVDEERGEVELVV